MQRVLEVTRWPLGALKFKTFSGGGGEAPRPGVLSTLTCPFRVLSFPHQNLILDETLNSDTQEMTNLKKIPQIETP